MQQTAPDVNKLAMEQADISMLMHVINMLPNPVYIKNRSHEWVEVNAAFCDFLGYSREELLGKSDYDFNPPEQAKIFWEKDDLVFSTKRENVNLEETTNSMGGLRWVESRKSYYQTDNGEEFIIGVLTDVTEMKEREEALLIAEQKAVSGAKAKTNFLAVMSHEIRTPMQGVMGMAQILKNTPLDHSQIEMVDTLERSGDALLLVIDDILDFSSLETGTVTLGKDSFVLKDMIESLALLMGVSAREKGLDLIVSTDPNLPKAVIGDEGRLRQILSNLIKNAIKFTEKGFVSLDVYPESAVPNSPIVFSVKDSGVGIPKDKQAKIFDKFSQADYSTTRVYGGTGLGLSISRSLAELMRGQLTVTSEEGQGSDFRLKVKLPVDTAVENDPLPLPLGVEAQLQNILIVDDVEANYTHKARILERMGLSVDYAANARDAVRRLAEAYRLGRPYSLLITDYLMPEVDGLCLVTSIRQNAVFNNLRIIVMSSMTDAEVEQTFMSQDVSHYLTKPVLEGHLRDSVHETLKPVISYAA